MEVRLKRAFEKDVEVLYDIEKRCFDDPYSKEQLYEDLTDTEFRFILKAYLGFEVIGYISFLIVEGEAEILRIAVIDYFRNRGFGTQILQKSLEGAKTLANKVFLEVASDNDPAYHLYHKFGFEIVNIRERYYNGKVDALVMARDL